MEEIVEQNCRSCDNYVWNGDDDPSWGCDFSWNWQDDKEAKIALKAFRNFGASCPNWKKLDNFILSRTAP